jgi:hypothetical protein
MLWGEWFEISDQQDLALAADNIVLNCINFVTLSCSLVLVMIPMMLVYTLQIIWLAQDYH